MILYESKASFIAWPVLMIIMSPFLQLLATVFGAYGYDRYGNQTCYYLFQIENANGLQRLNDIGRITILAA